MYRDPDDERTEGGPVSLQAPSAAQTAPSGAGTGAPGVGVGAPGAPGPGQGSGTGFVGLDAYLNANRGAAEGMASGIAGDIAAKGQQAQGQLAQLQQQAVRSSAPSLDLVNPSLYGQASKSATEAATAAGLAQTPGGLSALLGQKYGTPGGYTTGMRGFDAALTGAAGADQLAQAGQQYGGLESYLSAAGSKYAPSAPGSKPFQQGPPAHAPVQMESGETQASGGGSDWDEEERKRWEFGGNQGGGR